MPNRDWSHICKKVGRAADGQWLPIGEVRGLYVPRVPIVVKRLHVISKWSGAENEHFTVQIIMKSPSGRIIGKSHVDDCVIKRNRNNVLSARMMNAVFLQIPIRELGEHRVEFLVNKVLFHEMPLGVALVEGSSEL